MSQKFSGSAELLRSWTLRKADEKYITRSGRKAAEKPAAPNQTIRKNRRYIPGMSRESVTTLQTENRALIEPA